VLPLPQTVQPRSVGLTWREIDVLGELLNDGAENKTIGKRLFLTEDTIKTHMRRILSKTKIPNRTALVIAILCREIETVDPNRRVVKF
jgi:DNA-binding NarL/FixJ family response regulator